MLMADELLHDHLRDVCPEIHSRRLQSLMDVAAALQSSRALSLTSIARKLKPEIDIKHRVKKVDRLEGNKHLYQEVNAVYEGLSDYIFKYISHDKNIPIIIDLCYLKDTHEIQMLSAEVATKGRSIPIYREVFGKNELKQRAGSFIKNVSKCIPEDRKALLVMDAAFGEEWFEAIEEQDWYWLVRARRGKHLRLSEKEDWKSVGDIFSEVGERAKCYPSAYITKKSPRPCRVITKGAATKSTRKRPKKLPRNYNSANGGYQRIAKEPWVLATNLPPEYTTTQVLNYYKKRMQIEESFRDVKSHQYGLGGRDIRTRCVHRWGVKMLLAAIAQIMLWIIGVVGHSQDFQRVFQANTVRHKKVFSYFYLGMLIVEHDKLKDLKIDPEHLAQVIDQELARDW